MGFRKSPRSCRTPSGWRLATVKEAQQHRESIKRDNLLDEWDRARLLDGWIGGSAYDFQAREEFRSCVGHMLLINSPTPEISSSSSDDMQEGLYTHLTLTEKGRRAALFMCCEDWNYEVVCWLINCWSQLKGVTQKISMRGMTTPLSDDRAEASRLVSGVATELQNTRAMKGVQTSRPFSRASLRDMISGILNSLQDNIKDVILAEVLGRIELLDLGDQCWNEMGLTEDLGRFQHYEFQTTEETVREEIADTVFAVTTDAVAVAIVRYCIFRNDMNIDPPSFTGDRMGDLALIASVVAYSNQHLHKSYYGCDSLWGIVKEAAKTAQGNSMLFKKILLCDKGYGSFSYDDEYGVLNTVLVQAAKKGDLKLVERLIECGVQPHETDDKRRKTALHHAANLDNESTGVQIAETLLNKVRGQTGEMPTNVRDHKQRTPLHRAALCGHARMCRVLIDHNASVSLTDQNDQIPLHCALAHEHQNEEVVNILISADKASNKQGTAHSVDAKDSDGKTPLHLAVECQGSNVRMVTWLLSLSKQPQDYLRKQYLSAYLRESSRSGYHHLVNMLLDKGANALSRDNEGKTALHYAAEGKDEGPARSIISELLMVEEKQVKRIELALACDKYGRSALHVAAFVGHKELCRWLLSLEGVDFDSKDQDGQSAVYYAVAGTHDDDQVLDALIFRGSSRETINIVDLIDSSGTTPLHTAAARGNLKMVGKLLSKRLIPKSQNRTNFVRAADVLGQTALHKASSGGHKQVVRKLLDEGAHPLEERDCDGKTALHYAAQAENDDDALAIAKLLLSKCDSDKEKPLLLFASAVGIGSAEENLPPSSSLKKYLVKERSKGEEKNLHRVAARLGNVDMTKEFINGDAKIADIRSQKWKDTLSPQEKQNVEKVLKQIDNSVEQRTDQPALWDNLGRSAFANGLAALFLNPFVKSPITVGISGEWGMGKSSVMVQTESILLKTAAQLALSNPLCKSKLTAKVKAKRENLKLSVRELLMTNRKGDESNSASQCLSANKNEPPSKSRFDILHKFGRLIKCFFCTKEETTQNAYAKVGEPLIDVSGSYHPKDRGIYKSLAVMDHGDMIQLEDEEEDEESGSSRKSKKESKSHCQMQGTIPSILTVRYNAWQYRNESEAWAGLAVEITKELEATMTVAQRLRTSWRYNWTTRKRSILVEVILPCFLAVFMVVWFTTMLWLVLDKSKGKNSKEFKYGSLPATIIVTVWAVVKSAIAVVKPISSQMVDYICLPDHTNKLGYHQNVIFDINFLKNELDHKPSWLWNALSFIWCCITFCWNENCIPGTDFPKMNPASQHNLRMVVFVDELDRCQENVILQILSAVNLVLSACEINVVLGMDKSMIERAIIRMFGDRSNRSNKSNQDLADKYLRKIIQLPLDLPDPSDSESKSFLHGQLGMLDTRKGATHSEAETEIHVNGHAHRKLNPKFRMRTFISRSPKLGETMASWGETGVTKERVHISGTDTAGRGIHFQLSDKQEHKDTLGESVVKSAEETKIPIAEPDIDRSPKKEQHAGLKPYTSTQKSWMTWIMKCFRSKQPANIQSEQEPMDTSPITSEMLIPKYSKGEKDAFCFLQTKATGGRKLPREWKRLFNYHRLAWNILSKSKEVKTLAGWQVQLIAWLFVCWQWKDRINTLIEDWHDLGALKNWITVNDDHQGEVVQENTSGPSLREIVDHYIDERWPAGKSTSICHGDSLKENLAKMARGEEVKNLQSITEKKGEDINSHMQSLLENGTRNSWKEDKRGENYLMEVIGKVIKEETREQERVYSLKLKELEGRKDEDLEEWLKIVIRLKVLQEEKELEDWLKVIVGKVLKEDKGESSGTKDKGKGKIKVNKKDEEERDEWRKLRETLSRYNVSMDGIQAFQKFRFYCVPGHLPWPLHKPDKNCT